MMRKLAVTVFAMSLALVGCGSSSTTKKDVGAPPDSKTADTGVAADTKPAADTNVTPGAEAGVPDAATDVIVITDVPVGDAVVDGPRPDVAPTEGGLDVVVKLDTTPDTIVKLDVPPVDAPEAGVIDAPGDGAPHEGGTTEAGGDAVTD